MDYQEGERTAEAYSAPYIESSAKQNVNVEETFDLVLTQIFKQNRNRTQTKRRKMSVLVEEKVQMEAEACCSLF